MSLSCQIVERRVNSNRALYDELMAECATADERHTARAFLLGALLAYTSERGFAAAIHLTKHDIESERKTPE